MAQNKWLWGNFFVGLVDEGRGIKLRFQRFAASPPATLWNGERETKPHPQPLSEERGEWLVMKMEGVILGLIGGGDVVDNKA
ncbi:hypothetical protein [Segatella salivae]|uniref:hypothetical protein n=1 Tax=Segatella salivae TaxID=228604 RepID=UPI00352EA427